MGMAEFAPEAGFRPAVDRIEPQLPADLSARLPHSESARAIPHGQIVRAAPSQAVPVEDSSREKPSGNSSVFATATLFVLERVLGHIAVAPGVSLRPRPSGDYEFALQKIGSGKNLFGSLRTFRAEEGIFEKLVHDGHCLTGHTPSAPALRFFRIALTKLLPHERDLAAAFRAWEASRDRASEGEAGFHFRGERLAVSVEPYRPTIVQRGGYQLMRLLQRYPPSSEWYEIKVQGFNDAPEGFSAAKAQGLARLGYMGSTVAAAIFPAIYNVTAAIASSAEHSIAKFSSNTVGLWYLGGSAALCVYAASVSWLTARGDSAHRLSHGAKRR